MDWTTVFHNDPFAPSHPATSEGFNMCDICPVTAEAEWAERKRIAKQYMVGRSHRRLVAKGSVDAGKVRTTTVMYDTTDVRDPNKVSAAGLPLWFPKPDPRYIGDPFVELDDIERSRFLD